MVVTVTERARLYQTVRTAHLERAKALAPATILYRATRNDFDRTLTGGLDLVPAGPVRAAWLLARSGVRQLEVNEPLMLRSLRRTALVIVVLKLGHLVGRPRTRFVSYAIENADPFYRPAAGRARLRRLEDRLLARLVWTSLDRVVYGTAAARLTYRAAFPRVAGPASSTDIEALPAPCSCAESTVPDHSTDEDGIDEHAADDVSRVVFLGALSARKGFPQLLAAWPYLKVRLPGVRLQILGTGPLADQARLLADSDPAVELRIDPARTEIHDHLHRATVLILPSQPAPEWREQVGLPICEGLAHGCAIVSSTETGLSGWLIAHGHTVLPPSAPADDWAGAVHVALRERRSRSAILDDLPRVDGRLAADMWLFDS